MTRPTLRGVSHLLVKLYPAEFRRRHADELHATLDEFGEQAIRPAVVLDLARGVARERVSALFDLGPATLISLLVAAPFLVMLTMVAADYEPPFVSAMTGPDGTPGPLGRVVMVGWLVSLPVALAINAWPRFTGPRAAPRFVPPLGLTALGLGALGGPVLLIGDQLARELRPIGAALGSGMVLTPLAIAACGVPSIIMLLNRAPALGLARVRPGQHATTIGANLVVGSTLMMLVVLLATTFAAEATACAIGVPNCD